MRIDSIERIDSEDSIEGAAVPPPSHSFNLSQPNSPNYPTSTASSLPFSLASLNTTLELDRLLAVLSLLLIILNLYNNETDNT